MRIHSLTMTNFRGFEDATLDLDRPLTVLFGVNGSGKSSVLVACACALSRVIVEAHPSAARPDAEQIWRYVPEDTDIRRGTDELSVKVTLSNADITREVAVNHPNPEHNWRASHPFLLRLHAAAPALAVLYEASRDVAGAKEAFAPQGNGSDAAAAHPFSTILDSLAAGRVRFRPLFQWFKEREDVENELKVAQQDLSLEDPQLAAVRRAITGMLPGFSGLRIQRDPLHMVIRKGDATLMVDQLSDGEKLLLALAADLARRLAMTYLDHADPLQGEAIVLIDGVELHLHPSWQRQVLASLRHTFPNCQFIVTTHSPQVISEALNEAVVLIDNFQFVRPSAPTAGRDSNAILAEVMDTSERPSASLEAIRGISALLDEGRHDEAKMWLDDLAVKLSERDREVVGLRTRLYFLEGGDKAHPKG
jgi:AAA domain, putative AbiEii toxin, Type IV TA system